MPPIEPRLGLHGPGLFPSKTHREYTKLLHIPLKDVRHGPQAHVGNKGCGTLKQGSWSIERGILKSPASTAYEFLIMKSQASK